MTSGAITATMKNSTRRMIRSTRRRAAAWPSLVRHRHAHQHGRGTVHVHWHDHDDATSHAVTPDLDSAPPQHAHNHKTTARTALLLILGSSPMVEGIPAFFAAGKYGVGVIGAMAVAVRAQYDRHLRRALRLLDGRLAARQSRRVRALRRSIERRFHRACWRSVLVLASRLGERSGIAGGQIDRRDRLRLDRRCAAEGRVIQN